MIRIMRYGEIPDEQIFFRGEIKTDVAGIVSDIIANVRARGDAALMEYAARFDGDTEAAADLAETLSFTENGSLFLESESLELVNYDLLPDESDNG